MTGPGHVEPLVLEGVEGVEEGGVGVDEQLGDPGDGFEGNEGALDEEDELHGAAEDGVDQGLAEGGLVGLVLFHALSVVLLQKGDVSYFVGVERSEVRLRLFCEHSGLELCL